MAETRASSRGTGAGALAVALALALSGLAGSGPAGAARAPGRHATPVTLEGDGLGAVHLGTPQAVATRALAAQLGTPSGHPPAGCVGGYSNVAWHDLIVQFKKGRMSGYRYWDPNGAGGRVQGVVPTLSTAKGITLGSPFAQLKRNYVLVQTGTDFWSADGMTFGLGGAAYPSPPSAPVYEVKVAACPAAL